MDYNSIIIKQPIKILIKKYRFTDADNINSSFSVSEDFHDKYLGGHS